MLKQKKLSVAIASAITVAMLGGVFLFTQYSQPSATHESHSLPLTSTESTSPIGLSSPLNSVVSPAAIVASTATSKYTPLEEALMQTPDVNEEYPTFGHRVSEISNRRNGQPVDVVALYAASQLPSAWQTSDTLPDNFPLSEEDRIDGREFITVNPLKIESLVPGDSLDIDIAQINGHFTARIDRVQVQADNNVSWFGHLENVPGLEGQTQVYLTRGDNLIVGGITTPDGHFEIEARGTQGWIASGATLFKHGDELVSVDQEALSRTPAVSQEALAQKHEPIYVIPSMEKKIP